ncbi:hypothetical protein K501DRAFT_334352 [Backusella circina FSU 941]|nr:hypothetical protein K501DRAFT_334352 [Backusella circina FSU 941]
MPITLLMELEIAPYVYHNHPYSINWLTYFPKYTKLKDECRSDYQVQMPLLIQKCGSNLMSFYLNCFLDPNLNMLKEIDDLECHLNELEIDAFNKTDKYSVLARTNQAKPQETYTGGILDTAAYEERVTKNKIDMVKLFNHFPDSLESINIINAYFNFDALIIHSIFYQIKALELEDVELKKGRIDEFISDCLPNLSLPTEILHNIFIYLPIVQKSECLYVCRQWREVIRNLSLFNTIHIKSIKALVKFRDLAEQNPTACRQVESLTMSKCVDHSFSKKELLLLFPNLKKIRLIKIPEKKSISPRSSSPDTSSRQELDLTSTLKNFRMHTIEDFNEFELVRLLLARDFCSHLVTLTLHAYTVYSSSSYIFRSLKNMPHLKNLNVFGFDLTMDGCEMIHANIPSLESLKFGQVDFLPCVLPKSIIPATSITQLDVIPDFSRTQAINPGWLKYICRKYTNLRRLKYKLCTFYQYFELADAYQFQMPLLLQNCGSQLTSLSLNGILDLDLKVIKSLDKNGCRINELEMDIAKSAYVFDALTRTDQPKYIKALTLIHVLPKNNLKDLGRMKCLKSLTINYTKPEEFRYGGVDYGEVGYDRKRRNIGLMGLFNTFPESLESVSIRYAQIKCDTGDQRQQPKLKQIKKLHLEHVRLAKEKRLDDFISNYLPYLQSLALVHVSNLDREFTIPAHHLSDFELFPVPSLVHDFYKNVCLITKDCQSPRCYTKSNRQCRVYSDLSNCSLPLLLDVFAEEEFLTVACGSVKSFVFYGKEAYLASDKDNFKTSIMSIS